MVLVQMPMCLLLFLVTREIVVNRSCLVNAIVLNAIRQMCLDLSVRYVFFCCELYYVQKNFFLRTWENLLRFVLDMMALELDLDGT